MKNLRLMAVLGFLLVGLIVVGCSTAGAKDPLLEHSESIDRLETEVRLLSDDLETLRKETMELKKSLASIHGRLISLTGELDPVSQKVENLQQEYQGRVADLTRRVEELEKIQDAGRIEIEKKNWMRWKIQAEGNAYGDFSLSVDLKQVEGTPGYYGVLFRFAGDNLYYFWVRDDGFYGLSAGQGDKWDVLVRMTGTDAIKRNSWNRVAVEARGDRLSLFVNEKIIDTVVDDSFSEGRVAVVAETAGDQDRLKVLFSNFSIEELD